VRLVAVHHLVDLPGWQSIAFRQVDLLESSGLLDAAEAVHLLCHYEERSFAPLAERVEARARATGRRNVHLRFDPSVTPADAEVPSIGFVRDLAGQAAADTAILYLHTKGVTRAGDRNVEDWTRFLEYRVVEQWRDCVARLEAGFDTCGANFRTRPWPHYSGNFWWARAAYLRTLRRLLKPSEVGFASQIPGSREEARFDAEAWIGTGTGRHWSVDASPVRYDPAWHYRNPYPAERYREKPGRGSAHATRRGRLTLGSRLAWAVAKRLRPA
jgi:hypothetical protein